MLALIKNRRYRSFETSWLNHCCSFYFLCIVQCERQERVICLSFPSFPRGRRHKCSLETRLRVVSLSFSPASVTRKKTVCKNGPVNSRLLLTPRSSRDYFSRFIPCHAQQTMRKGYSYSTLLALLFARHACKELFARTFDWPSPFEANILCKF